MARYVCLHGHFYQPPRENPWLERIEKQDSAEPYHDWNERISAECYAPNTASRIVNNQNRIIGLINNYSLMSFNFGPTLLSWMEKQDPDTYLKILEADRQGMARFSGHGPAIAQVYNHMIMPLANRRDKHTQVLWGIRDFENRFGRKPEGMWLAETAVDLETLDILALCGIRFTVLAPRQASKVRRFGEHDWTDVSNSRVDPRRPYICKLPSGRSIHLFFYDGPVAQDVAFSDILRDGRRFVDRLCGLFNDDYDGQLAHIAADGESYGHHHRFGDMALAYVLNNIEEGDFARLTIYGEYLDLVPTEYEAQIYENSSWSCVHGIERWRADCGCNSGRHGWNQKWRGPLRQALDHLRDETSLTFEEQMSALCDDPWGARDRYIDVIFDRSKKNIDDFFAVNFKARIKKEERIKALKLLEMQRHAMFMYTSCGWFFDEISGIETVQIMQYASRVIQLEKEITGRDLEGAFMKDLAKAPSNLDRFNTGADVYRKYVQFSVLDLARIAVHYAISAFFEEKDFESELCCYETSGKIYERVNKDKTSMICGTVELFSTITQERHAFDFVVVDSGHYHIQSAIFEHIPSIDFKKVFADIKKPFLKGDLDKALVVMDSISGGNVYSLRHLFEDERRHILGLIYQDALTDVERVYRRVYKEQYGVMRLLRESKVPLPPIFAQTIAFVLNTDVLRLLQDEKPDFRKLKKIAGELKQWSKILDKKTLSFVFKHIIDGLFEDMLEEPSSTDRLEYLASLFMMMKSFHLELDLWKAQNIYFQLSDTIYDSFEKKAEDGDISSARWLAVFDSLESFLHVET